MSHAATSANLSPLLINRLSPSDKLLIHTIFHAEIEVSKCLSLPHIKLRRIFVLSVLKCRPNRYDLSLLHREDPIKYSQIGNSTSCEKARLRCITKFVNRLHAFAQHKGFGGPNAAFDVRKKFTAFRFDNLAIRVDMQAASLTRAVVRKYNMSPFTHWHPFHIGREEMKPLAVHVVRSILANHMKCDLSSPEINPPST